jgi:hypothetical protein
MEYEQLVKSYEAKSEADLLRLRLDSKDLTPEATLALANELAKRKIDSAERLTAFQVEEQKRKERESRNPGNLFLHFRLGVGRWNFGKADRTYDQSTGVERFRTTVFVLILFFPLIPTGSYLVERKRSAPRKKTTILEKVPLDWEQVLKVWVVSAACLLLLIWALRRA